MVSMLHGLRIERSGFGPGPGHHIVFLGKTLYSHRVLFSTQEYIWILANCQGNLTKSWGVTCDGLASHPGRVAIFTPSHLMIRKPGCTLAVWAADRD